MTAHISALRSEVAPLVIMPGDPKRAKYIAETYLENAKLVSDVRNIYVYTGTYNGKILTVMASGMGMPSMAIYAHELYSIFGVEKIIRVGTCGSLKEDLRLKDILLTSSVATDSNITIGYGAEEHLINSFSLNDRIKAIAQLLNISIKEANIFTTDTFYRNSYNYNYDAVEMETFILFYLAKHFNKEAASILTVSDSILTKEAISIEERQNSLDKAILLALESL